MRTSRCTFHTTLFAFLRLLTLTADCCYWKVPLGEQLPPTCTEICPPSSVWHYWILNAKSCSRNLRNYGTVMLNMVKIWWFPTLCDAFYDKLLSEMYFILLLLYVWQVLDSHSWKDGCNGRARECSTDQQESAKEGQKRYKRIKTQCNNAQNFHGVEWPNNFPISFQTRSQKSAIKWKPTREWLRLTRKTSLSKQESPPIEQRNCSQLCSSAKSV